MAKLDILSFDEAIKVDKKADELEVTRIEKEEQISNQVRDLKVKLARAKKTFRDSITNPKIDSIQIAVEVQLLEKQLELAKEIRDAIFPGHND